MEAIVHVPEAPRPDSLLSRGRGRARARPGRGGRSSSLSLRPQPETAEKASILALDLDGIIVDTRDIVENLRKYRKDDHIKGVLLRINSPGGVVGPSQELWAELKRTREEFKKPVVAFCGALAASGAYYAAVGADKIVTTPGCLIGSIGALMEFVDLVEALRLGQDRPLRHHDRQVQGRRRRVQAADGRAASALPGPPERRPRPVQGGGRRGPEA